MGEGRKYRIATYTSAKDNVPRPLEVALDELYALLEHEETDCVLADGSPGCRGKKCPLKDGLAWSPGFIRGGKTRLAANVETLDLAVFDIDHITDAQLGAMCDHLEGVELYLHTTHNHQPPNDQSFRLVLPFTRTITPVEWKQIWFAIVRRFELPQDPKSGVDKATRDPARLSFFPRAFRGRPHVNVHQDGVMLDPDVLLRENLRHSRQVVAAPHVPNEAGSVDLGDLRSFLRHYDPAYDPAYEPEYQGKEIISRVYSGEALAQKGFRGLTVLRAGTVVGLKLPLNTPVEAALEVMRPSISKMPVFEGDDPRKDSVDAWLDTARRGFEGGQATKAHNIANEESGRGKLVALAEKKKTAQARREWLGEPEPVPAASRAQALVPPQASMPAIDAPPSSEPVELELETGDEDDWRIEKLIVAVDKQGIPHPKNTPANVTVVLENHKEWKGVLKYNELTNEPEAHGGPIPEGKRTSARLVTAICDWLAHEEELDIHRAEVIHRIELVARERAYDPIKSYLTRLKHDNVARIGNWLRKYCHARIVTDDGLDVTDYVHLVGEKWLMAGAARGLYPGCKADNVLVFEGLQYEGKSKALDVLGGEWFADTQLNLSDKSTLELASNSWIIELSELSSMKKSETESQKSFFSKRYDKFRLSYAPRVAKFPRRCLFAGTTNETRYLLDLTGNRRFWCVWCDSIDIDALRRDRDQLWAEAVAKVRAGETCPNCHGIDQRCPEHRWWLDKTQTAMTEVVATTRLKADLADDIRAWWLNKEPALRPEHLTMRDIVVNALQLPIDRKETLQQGVGRAMKALGFEKHRIRPNLEWVYRPSDHMRTAPRVKSQAMTLAELAAEKSRTQPTPGDIQ